MYFPLLFYYEKRETGDLQRVVNIVKYHPFLKLYPNCVNGNPLSLRVCSLYFFAIFRGFLDY